MELDLDKNQSPFDISVSENTDFVFVLKIKGELRRGSHLSGLPWKGFEKQARAEAKKKHVIFDLTEMTFWDTGGMAEIVNTTVEINRAHTKRAGIVAPIDAHLLVLASLIEFARRKFDDGTISDSDLPVRSDKVALLAFLES